MRSWQRTSFTDLEKTANAWSNDIIDSDMESLFVQTIPEMTHTQNVLGMTLI